MRLDTSFCMDSGQVKTGEDKDDTYIKMLQEVRMITVSMAHGIANKYPDASMLLRGFKELGPLTLEDVRVCDFVALRLSVRANAHHIEIDKQRWRCFR